MIREQLARRHQRDDDIGGQRDVQDHEQQDRVDQAARLWLPEARALRQDALLPPRRLRSLLRNPPFNPHESLERRSRNAHR